MSQNSSKKATPATKTRQTTAPVQPSPAGSIAEKWKLLSEAEKQRWYAKDREAQRQYQNGQLGPPPAPKM
ncbi:hypothetical protein K438DRAFT_1823022 [Mycena galopus ATCC 62051]|nr:hypothetical protein K438DRAFT_1823022 [Mycena galopus ATCC 62051]